MRLRSGIFVRRALELTPLAQCLPKDKTTEDRVYVVSARWSCGMYLKLWGYFAQLIDVKARGKTLSTLPPANRKANQAAQSRQMLRGG